MAEPAPLPQAAGAGAWSAAAFAARQGSQLVGVVVLARLLDPDDFGIMAMALVVTGLASVVRDLGTGAAVVREREHSPAFLASQFWIGAAFGVVLAIGITLVAPLAASLFNEPDVVPLLQLLSLGFVLGGLAVVPQALLERRLGFRPIFIAELVGGVAGVAAGVAAAVAGWGALSLGVQAVVQTGALVIVLYAASRWLPHGRPTLGHMGRGLRFGLPLAGYSSLNYLVRNADNALIGVFLGPGPLGFYAVAYRLMLLPVAIVNSVVNRVLFPLMAAQTDDVRRMTYLAALGTTALIGFPIAAGLAGAADQVVAVLLGPGWEPVAPVLRILSIVAMAQVVGATVGPLFLATGRTRRLLAWGAVSSIATVVAFALGLAFGVVGVAAAYAAVSLILLVPSLAVALPLIRLPVKTALARVWPALAAALVVGVLALAIGVIGGGQPPVAVLVVQVAACATAYALLVWMLDRPTVQGVRDILRARQA